MQQTFFVIKRQRRLVHIASNIHMHKYQVLAQYLKNEIESGRLAYGDKLPTEDNLIKLFNISRITVRQALSQLEQSGYIRKLQGKGSFAAYQKTPMQLNILQGFTEEMRQKGFAPSTRLYETELITADAALAQRLEIEEGVQVYQVKRLRLADNVPMCIEWLHVPFYQCPNLDKEDLTTSVYDIFRNRYGHTLHYADQDIEAGYTGEEAAELLGVSPDAPALYIRRVTYLENNVPLEYVSSIYRGDRYRMHARLNLNP